jgi:RimJ/RimL family protein N-acetyltransferase
MNLDPSTPRLRAEPLSMAHLAEIERMHADPVAMAMLGGVRTPAESLAYLEKNLAHWAKYGYGHWLLRDAATGEMAGRAVLRHLDLDGVDEVEVGYGFHTSFWGRGLATEICRSLIVMGRKQLGLSTIVALTLPDHHASQRVMTKSDMVFDRALDFAGSPHVLFRTRPWSTAEESL